MEAAASWGTVSEPRGTAEAGVTVAEATAEGEEMVAKTIVCS